MMNCRNLNGDAPFFAAPLDQMHHNLQLAPSASPRAKILRVGQRAAPAMLICVTLMTNG